MSYKGRSLPGTSAFSAARLDALATPAILQQLPQQQVFIAFASSRDGNNRWNGRSQRHKNRLRVRQLIDFAGRKRYASTRRDESQKRREVLDVMPKPRRKSGGLTGRTDRRVASRESFFREADEVFLFQFGQGDTLAQGEQMIVRQHSLEREARENRHDEFAFDLGAGIPNEGEVEASFAQVLQLFARRQLTQRHFDVGMLLGKTAQGRSQNACEHWRNVTDRKALLRPCAERRHLLHCIPASSKQVARVREKCFPGARQLQTGLFASKQLDAQLVLQVAQLAAHRWLGNAQAC